MIAPAVLYHPLMLSDLTINPASTPADILAARPLFTAYGSFLQATQTCGEHFNPARFEQETAALPTPYTAHNGELLLACTVSSPARSASAQPPSDQSSSSQTPAACMAFRSSPTDISNAPQTCEFKRLFVLPAYRGQGIARQLVLAALARAQARSYARVILDTDVTHMPEAHALYLSLGFQEYAPRQGLLAFLHRSLA